MESSITPQLPDYVNDFGKFSKSTIDMIAIDDLHSLGMLAKEVPQLGDLNFVLRIADMTRDTQLKNNLGLLDRLPRTPKSSSPSKRGGMPILRPRTET